MTSVPTVRRADPEDAAALVDLRAAMIESVNGTSVSDNGWRQTCEQMLCDKLMADSQEWAAYVVDGADGVPVSCVVGWVLEHLPGPRNITSHRGYVASMSTAPEARGKGYGRAVFAALMAWFDAVGIDEVSLLASDMGAPLYAEFGFTVSGPKAMVWLRRR